jgi:hypothetical protein
MNAEHSFWAEHRDETGHGGSGADRHDDGGNVRELPQQFPAAFGVALRGQRSRAAERHEEWCRAGATQIIGDGGCASGKLHLVNGTRPEDLCTEQAIEREVACRRMVGCAGQHEDDVEAESRASCCCQPRVIALRCATSHKCAGTVGYRRGARPLQLANLVASATQAAEIVAFEPQVRRIETDSLRQPWCSFEWGWPGAKTNRLHRCRAPPFIRFQIVGHDAADRG